MKAKLVLMLLFVISFSLSAATSHRSKAKYKQRKKEHVMTRAPFDPTIHVDEVNGILLLTFQYSLEDADITITDKNGNEVMHEQQTVIYEGRVASIPEADGYPYSVEITSPTVDIQGEIVLE